MSSKDFPYYVYELIDPRSGAVFYVGKGKGKRIEAHESEARKGVSSDKCDQIRQIWASGRKVEKREVARFMDEDAAYDFEEMRIAQYTGLTNVMGREGRSRNPLLSPYAMKVLAWWLKQTNGGRQAPLFNNPDRPWGSALSNAMVRHGHKLFRKIANATTPEDLARRLRPWGVDLAPGAY